MSGPHFMPFYIGDYLRDTQHLTTEEHGIYLLLLMACWTRGALPDDRRQLSSIAKLRSRKWPVCRHILHAFFVRTADGFWHQKRVDKERQKAEIIREARSKAGSKSAAKRQQKVNSRARTTATATAKEEDKLLPSREPNGSLLTPQSPPSRGGRARAREGSGRKKSARMVQAEGFLHAALAPSRHC